MSSSFNQELIKPTSNQETQTTEPICIISPQSAGVRLNDYSSAVVDLSNVNSLQQQSTALLENKDLELQVKEKLIESINDELLLKDAEIARLKARIGLMERNHV